MLLFLVRVIFFLLPDFLCCCLMGGSAVANPFFSTDNAGLNPHLVHRETIESVVGAWPRDKWTGCFAATVREEIEYKPWCHSTHIEGFAEMVEGNKVMEEWD